MAQNLSGFCRTIACITRPEVGVLAGTVPISFTETQVSDVPRRCTTPVYDDISEDPQQDWWVNVHHSSDDPIYSSVKLRSVWYQKLEYVTLGTVSTLHIFSTHLPRHP